MSEDYAKLIYSIGVYNRPVFVTDRWYIRTKGDFMGTADRLYCMNLRTDNFGVTPSWSFIGFIRNDSFVNVTSNEDQ